MNHTKIAIIGAGAVGSTTAYALMLRNIAAEIMLVDINDLRCKGEMLDLSDTLPFSVTSSIHMASMHDVRNAEIIIFSAGIPQKPGQSRGELLALNKEIVLSVLEQLCPINPHTILIMVTNPVDILTRIAQQSCNLPTNQIFGTGTLLDSLRLRGSLATHLGIAEESIDAYVLGEHGDSQFAAWSCSHIAGTPIKNFAGIDEQLLKNTEQKTRKKAFDIIACKGATYYGIAACVSIICESIIFNQNRILPLSSYHQNFDVCLSLPVTLGERGINKNIPISLSSEEFLRLQQSIAAIKKTI